MRATSLSILVLTGVCLAPCPPTRGSAAPPERPADLLFHGESVDVNVVSVDVVVTGKDGKPVAGLRKGDFQLFEDGRPVDISNFDEIGGLSSASPATGPAAQSGGGDRAAGPAPAPLRLVIYFDHQNIRTANRTRAVEQIRTFVRDHLAPSDEVMVASHDLTLHVGQAFTSHRSTLDAVLARLETAPTYGDASDRDRVLALNNILSEQGLAKEHPKLGTLREPCTNEVSAPAERYAETSRDQVERTARALTVLIDSLAGIPGRKALLYVSDGVPLVPGEELFQVLYEMCGGDPSNGLNAAVSAETLGPQAYQGQRALLDAQRYSTATLWSRVTRHANSNRVTFYSLQGRDPAETLAGAAAGERAERFLRLQTVTSGLSANFKGTLSTLAAETGGRLIVNGTDLSSDFARLREDFRHYYSLGYSPPRRSKRAEHRIEVRVKGSGLRVAYQGGFADRSPVERVADRVLSSLFWDQPENPLDATMEVGDQQPAGDGSVSVPLRLRIPLFKLAVLNQGEEFRADLRLIVASRDAKGSLDPLRQVAVPIRIPNREVLKALGQYYVYNLTLRLLPGERRVAIAIRDEVAATASYLTLTIQVAAGAASVASATGAPHD